jgi:DNA-binding LacI/PurR family transcriptional regulator
MAGVVNMADDSGSGRSKPSIYDVARRAGVSHMTVSRVLNGHPHIRESTRARVNQAIDELQYTRSSIARALARRRAMRIGVIVDSAVQWGPNSTLRAVESAARGFEYSVSSFTTSERGVEQIGVGIADLVAQGIDALCVIAPRVSSLRILREHSTHMPTLVITAEHEADLHTAAVDQRAGAQAVMTHLLELGHRSIAHIAGPSDWHDSRAREQAWRDGLAAAGLPASTLVAGDWTSDRGYEIGRSLDLDDVTAVFAANDQTALGFIHALTERGIRVPWDVSVVGFDDLPDARHFLPPLTTVRQDFVALGELAVRQLVAAIEGEDPPVHDVIVPELIVRGSTAAPSR